MHREPSAGTGARPSHSERGAVLVETALLLPLMLLLVFGIIELSALYTSAAQVTDGTRSGARTGSALARTPDYAVNIADAAESALSRMPSTAPEEIWIYRANDEGYPGADGNTSFTSCSSNCISYQWLPAQERFDTDNPGGNGWPAGTHNVCDGQPFDEVGVYVKATHAYYTGFFGESRTLVDHAVFRFEPQPSEVCTAP